MEKIIITIDDDIKPDLAIKLVEEVIKDGKVSEDTKGRKYYCWATSFSLRDDKIVVFTRQTKNENLASFNVIKAK